MYMGTGGTSGHGMGDGGGVWAYTNTFAVGDYIHLTFTVAAGRICGHVNGVRSGDCSANLRDDERQIGTGAPLEVGGEDSYTSHPLWSIASLMYYNRALSEEEVVRKTRPPLRSLCHADRGCRAQAYNYAASNCLEKGTQC